MALNAVIYFIVYMLALHLWQGFKKRGEVFQLLRGMRFQHLRQGLLILIVTGVSVLVMAVLTATVLPVLKWSWLSALAGQVATPVSVGASKAVTVPSFVIFGMYAMLVLSMPMLVMAEEKMFRKGADKRGRARNVMFAIAFGLTHAIVGVPLFLAIALIPMGLLLTRVYLRTAAELPDSPHAALLDASRAHLINNAIAMSVFLTAFLVKPA